MKKLIITLIIIISSASIYAQIGINGGMRLNGTTDWQYFTTKEDFLNSGFKVGLDYWFRLKKVRVEFTPEVNFSQFKDDYITSIDEKFKFKSTVYGLHFNTNIYPLNFKDDCNCPTFQKDGQIIEKGFHFIVSPGVNYFDFSINGDEFTSNDIVFSAGLGAGLDIGLSDFLTFTPMVMYHRYFGAEWEDLETALPIIDDITENASSTTDINQFFFGARLRLRLDEMNKYGYR